MAELAVIIVSWNVRELLAACLRSLLNDVRRTALQSSVWVVDNASTDGTPRMVQEHFPEVQLVVHERNLGFAAGNNVALNELMYGSSGTGSPSFVWLLNPDTAVKPGTTAALLRAMDSDVRAAVVGAKLLYPDGLLQHSAFRFPGLIQLAFELFPMPRRLHETSLNGRYRRHRYDGKTPFPIDHPLGASMLVRAAAISQVGLLDEGYRMYCEEIDWCWRMHRAGWRRLCAPAAEVIHHGGQSTSQAPLPSFVNLWISRARLYARYQGPLTWPVAKAMVRVAMRRRMADAEPEMAQACRDIIRAWTAAR